MLFTPWLRSLKFSSRLTRTGRRRKRRHLRHAVCEVIEVLEDRVLLASWSGTIPDGTLFSNSEVQRITGDATVAASSTLTIEPGTVVQFDSGRSLTISGTLIADGTASDKIVFTSVLDDTGLDGVLGTADDTDTTGNGASNGAPGDWQRIRFASSSTANVMDHTEVRYAGNGHAGGNSTG